MSLFDHPSFRQVQQQIATIFQTATFGNQYIYATTCQLVGSLDGTSFAVQDTDGNVISDLVEGSIVLVQRRQVLKAGVDFTYLAGTITMTTAPFTAGEVAAGAAAAATTDFFYIAYGYRAVV